MEALLQNEPLRLAVLALLASPLFIKECNDALAALLAKVPVIGWAASMLVRRVTPTFWAWLKSVADSAEQAVRTAETTAITGPTKKQHALEKLKQLEPGVSNSQADRAIEAALERIKSDQRIYRRATREAQ